MQKYIILTGHVYFPWHWVASKKWFDGLSDADQKLIKDAVQEARAYGTQMEDQMDAFYAAELKKHGMEFITPDNKAIRAQAMPAIQRAVGELAPEVAAEVDQLTQ